MKHTFLTRRITFQFGFFLLICVVIHLFSKVVKVMMMGKYTRRTRFFDDPTNEFLLTESTADFAAATPSQQKRGGVTLHIYDNMGLAGPPSSTTVINTTAFYMPANKELIPFSAEMIGTLLFPPEGSIYSFVCDWFGSTMGFVWIDGHMVCQDGNVYRPSKEDTDYCLPINMYPSSSKGVVAGLPFRAHFYYNGTTGGKRPTDSIGLSVHWISSSVCRISSTLSSAAVPIPTTSLYPKLPDYEAMRDRFQRRLSSSGWGPWIHSNMLSLVLLPDATTITVMICQASNTSNCIESALPDGARPFPSTDDLLASIRVGHHAYDRSYVQFYVGPSPTIPLNVSVEYSVNKADFDMEIRPISCTQQIQAEYMLKLGMDNDNDCSDFLLLLEFRYAWFKSGDIQTNDDGSNVTFSPSGRPTKSIYTSKKRNAKRHDKISIGESETLKVYYSMEGDPITVSTKPNRSLNEIRNLLDNAKAAEEQLLRDTFSEERAGQGQAIKAASMWTLISTPAENGGAPLLPVSRAWTRAPRPSTTDFTYVIFDWDNFFGSLAVACGRDRNLTKLTRANEFWSFAYSVSNLIQTVKTKTSTGFIPNYAAAGRKTQDRSEPPVGAKVTLELVRKFGTTRMKWVVETVFDDLLDWNDWFLRKRLKDPLKLVALGTYDDQSQKAGQLFNSKLESGLDNSPMYDDATFNGTDGCGLQESGCGLMDMYDLGMTAMFVQEAYSLAHLAHILERPAPLVDLLTQRGDRFAERVRRYLWDEKQGVFVNRAVVDADDSSSFNHHVSPTSFYALFAQAATDEQALRMTNEWLLNSSRFCVAAGGDFSGNSDECYWGLPSIQASDPAFRKLGYWRGYIWGPMALLTYWGLLQYDHVLAVRLARQALCKQMADLMMHHWNRNRHICENYNPKKLTDEGNADCSGTRFYHWGALNGLIGMMEDDLF